MLFKFASSETIAAIAQGVTKKTFAKNEVLIEQVRVPRPDAGEPRRDDTLIVYAYTLFPLAAVPTAGTRFFACLLVWC